MSSQARAKQMGMTESGIQAGSASPGRIWTGRVLSALVVLFLVFDGVTKVIKERHVMAASVQLGFPGDTMPLIGGILLICTLIYVIPRTALLGAVLLTGYLGGAVASQLRAGSPAFENLFPVIFGMLVWAGLFMREPGSERVFFRRR
jgi:DoxX-like family